MPRVLVGRTHDLYGKSVWELLCNLKDFGVGRVIMKTKPNRRYPERTWMRVLKVEPQMDEELRRGSVLVHYVFRGVDCGQKVMSRTTAATDYQLVPKHEEEEFCQLSPERLTEAVRVLPDRVPKPPLLAELERLRGESTDPLMPAVYQPKWYYRIQETSSAEKQA